MKSEKFVTYVKKRFSTNNDNEIAFRQAALKKKYHKVRYHCHYAEKFRGAAHSICNLRYKTQNEIPIVLHNGSTYDYHFIINKPAKEFDGQLERLGEIYYFFSTI